MGIHAHACVKIESHPRKDIRIMDTEIDEIIAWATKMRDEIILTGRKSTTSSVLRSRIANIRERVDRSSLPNVNLRYRLRLLEDSSKYLQPNRDQDYEQ